jgi:hydroxyquinol 1,2-dioxygenase
VEGRVCGVDGEAVGGARLDVWEADSEGLYDVQRDGATMSARGVLHTDDDGGYRFWCVTPTPYPIPTDGPVGAMLRATERSAMRAPHLHVKATAPGYRTLVTHVFVAGGEVVDDSVFGVRESLLREFVRSTGPTPDGRAVDGTWTTCRFDLVLARE